MLFDAHLLGAIFVVTLAGDLTTNSFYLLIIKSDVVNPEGVLKNWSTSNDLCSWNGLVCSENVILILVLNLTGSGLSGSIFSECYIF